MGLAEKHAPLVGCRGAGGKILEGAGEDSQRLAIGVALGEECLKNLVCLASRPAARQG